MSDKRYNIVESLYYRCPVEWPVKYLKYRSSMTKPEWVRADDREKLAAEFSAEGVGEVLKLLDPIYKNIRGHVSSKVIE